MHFADRSPFRAWPLAEQHGHPANLCARDTVGLPRPDACNEIRLNRSGPSRSPAPIPRPRRSHLPGNRTPARWQGSVLGPGETGVRLRQRRGAGAKRCAYPASRVGLAGAERAASSPENDGSAVPVPVRFLCSALASATEVKDAASLDEDLALHLPFREEVFETGNQRSV